MHISNARAQKVCVRWDINRSAPRTLSFIFAAVQNGMCVPERWLGYRTLCNWCSLMRPSKSVLRDTPFLPPLYHLPPPLIYHVTYLTLLSAVQYLAPSRLSSLQCFKRVTGCSFFEFVSIAHRLADNTSPAPSLLLSLQVAKMLPSCSGKCGRQKNQGLVKVEPGVAAAAAAEEEEEEEEGRLRHSQRTISWKRLRN